MTTAELHEILDDENRKLTVEKLRKILQELKQDCNDEYYKEFMGKGEEDIVNGNSVYFGTVPTKYIDADKLWNNRPIVPDGKSQDYMTGFMECMWAFRELIQKSPTADVIPKSEVDNLKVLLEMKEKAYEGLKELYDTDTEALVRAREKTEVEVAREIFAEIDLILFEYNMIVNCEDGFILRYAELKKKYTK